MSKYLSDAHVAKYLSKLHAHTASSLRKAQKWHVPFVITNTINQTYLSTYDEQNGVDAILLDGSNKTFKNIKAIYVNEDVAKDYNDGDIIETKVYYTKQEPKYIDIATNGEEIFAITNEGYIIRDIFNNLKYYRTIGYDNISEEYEQQLKDTIDSGVKYEDIPNIEHVEFIDGNVTLKLQINKRANINVVDKYRYNGRYYSHKYSVSDPDGAFGILEIDNLPYNSFSNRVNKKCFYGRLERLVYQGLIEPMMLFINHKFVKWDDINIVYDSDESWLVLSGEKYTYENLVDKEINLVIMPFKCEYIGEESDYDFNKNYEALTNYLQDNSKVKPNGDLYLTIPTMDTVYKYNKYPVNVGGWMYYQIKRNYLGLLSEERVKKLSYIPVYKYIKDSSGIIQSSKYTRFNALDKDSYKSEELFNTLNYIPFEGYSNYTALKFNDDGLLDMENGKYAIYITNESTQVHIHESSDDLIYCDLSEINNVLFRENYLVFNNGYFQSEAKLMTSINNIVLYDNPDENKISIIGVYDKHSAHVIRNTDRFLKSYMNDKARKYLEVLYYHNYETETGLDADTGNLVYKNIDAYFLDTEFAVMPKLTDYIVYLNDQNTDVVNLVNKAIEPLDFTIDRSHTLDVSNAKALDAILDYDPTLLKDAYVTYIDSKVFTGTQANDNLIYTFMYQSKRGLKIPRKKYKNHETYIMVFLNGELFDHYYKTIAYANFFFIPVEDDYSFNASDRLEVLYFKNVNNNEINFTFNRWIYTVTMNQSEEDSNFYNLDIFKQFIRPDELQIFSHYPKNMLIYPTVIREPHEDVAFNIAFRDSNNRVCIKNSAISHIADGFENTYGVDIDDGSTYDDIMFETDDDLTPGTDPTHEVTTADINIIDVTTGESLASKYDTETLYDMLVATSCHKFVYQRLYVDKKSYRIALDKRFRYCDNQRQYILFINGRRMKQDSYLVSVPKYTRPFYKMFLYTARFVGPEDRVELFYVPYEMTDINIDNKPRCEVRESGYLDYDKTDLDVPLSKDLYLFFINGKKIPPSDIIDIDSHTIRFTTNINTLKYPCVTPINVGDIKQVSDNLRDPSKTSKYDSLVQYIRNHSPLGYGELDKVFGYYNKITDGEEDKTWANVAHIAILNELVRDFWVASGYNYQDQIFVYDYETDELYEQDEESGTLILPTMDATPYINIEKNIVSLLYFYTEPTNLLFEKGSTAESFKFFWDYSQRLNQDLDLVSQSINGVNIPIEDREYEWIETINEPKNFRFIADTGFRYLIEDTKLDFVNGIYWGTVDEDSLQYYHMKKNIVYLSELVALLPKNGIMPNLDYMNLVSGEPQWQAKIYDENTIIRGISYDENTAYVVTQAILENRYLPGKYISNIHARTEDGQIFYDITLIDMNTNEQSTITISAEIMYDEQGKRIIDYLPILDVFNGEEVFAITENNEIIHDIFGQIIFDRAMSYTNFNIQNVYSDNFFAILDDGNDTRINKITYQYMDHTIDNPELYSTEDFDTWYMTGDTMLKREMNTVREYYDVSDLHQLMWQLDKHLLKTADIKLNDYIIGNNKYFVFACPRSVVTDNNIHNYAEFFFPDIKSDEILSNCRDDKTSPVYTNGRYDKKTKLLHELESMKMEFMGEFNYTNDYGYTEPYMMWKTNGFFTRLFDNYGFDIRIRISGNTPKVDFKIDNKDYTNIINYTENNAISSSVIPKTRKLSLNLSREEYNSIMNDEEQTTNENNNDINNIGVELIDNIGSNNNGKHSDEEIKEMLDNGIFLI